VVVVCLWFSGSEDARPPGFPADFAPRVPPTWRKSSKSGLRSPLLLALWTRAGPLPRFDARVRLEPAAADRAWALAGHAASVAPRPATVPASYAAYESVTAWPSDASGGGGGGPLFTSRGGSILASAEANYTLDIMRSLGEPPNMRAGVSRCASGERFPPATCICSTRTTA
jgi:hypothetical protein